MIVAFTLSARRPGMVLLELIVALGVMLFFLVAFAQLLFSFSGDARVGAEQVKALQYATEGLEGARSIADREFSEVTPGDHGLDTRNGHYAFSGSLELMGDFSRTLMVSQAQRDVHGDIVVTGGTNDPATVAVTSTVTWNAGTSPLTVSLSTYLTQWMLGRWMVDLLAEFVPGQRNGTILTEVGNGEAQLEKRGNMMKSSLWLSTGFPGSSTVTNIEPDTVRDMLYLSTMNNASGGEFFGFDLSDLSASALSLAHSAEIGADVRGFAADGTYAYVLTSAKTIRVLRLSDFQTVATWSMPFLSSLDHIVVDAALARAYVAVTVMPNIPALFVLDISDPTSPIANIVSAVVMPAVVSSLDLSGHFAFLATSVGNGKVTIEDLDTMGSPVTCNLSGAQNITQLQTSNNRLYVGRQGGNDVEFQVFELSGTNPSDCWYLTHHLLGSADFGTQSVVGMDVDGTIGNAFLTLSGGSQLGLVDLSTYWSTTVPLQGSSSCNAVQFLGSTVYAGCPVAGQNLQAMRGDLSGYEQIYTEGMQNGWLLSDQGGNVSNRLNTLLTHSGSLSLLIRPSAGGSTLCSKPFRTASSGSLVFSINTVSPWAFGLYSGNGGTPPATTTVTNTVFGSSFATNANVGAFTDFPSADYDALKAIAQASSTYFDAAHSHETFTAAELRAMEGKLAFVDFADNGKKLVVDFENTASTYNVSIVVRGGKGIILRNYRGTTLSSPSNTFPVLATDGYVHLDTNAQLTLNGVVYAEDELDSSSQSSSNRVTIHGSLVVGAVDSSLRYATIAYDAGFEQAHSPFFTPSYGGQDIEIRASAGASVRLSSYLPGAIDVDPSTWQYVSIPIGDMGLSRTTISSLRLTNPSGASQPAYFIDDLELIQGVDPVATWGTYTSPVFDGGTSDVAWRNFSWAASGGGNITFRLRTADSQAGLQQARWVGSDGTPATAYDVSGQGIVIDSLATGTRWAQWKAYFSGDGTEISVLGSVTLTYP